jgi:sphinganine-1-phosphate aldolase
LGGGSGYIQSCKEIVGAAKKIQAAITQEIPELYVLGNPLASVVAFGSRSPIVNVMEVGDAMSTKGWHLNALSNPPAVHIACTVSGHFRVDMVYVPLTPLFITFLAADPASGRPVYR